MIRLWGGSDQFIDFQGLYGYLHLVAIHMKRICELSARRETEVFPALKYHNEYIIDYAHTRRVELFSYTFPFSVWFWNPLDQM